MMRICILVPLLFLTCLFPLAAEESEDKTGKVFTGLANLTLARDAVLPRYACLAVGERHILVPGSPPRVDPFYKVRMENRRSQFDYMGTGRVVMPNASVPFETQHWLEYCRCDGVTKVRRGFINPRTAFDVKPDQADEGRYFSQRGFRNEFFDPFDDILHVATFIESDFRNTQTVEKIFLRGAQFVSSRQVLNSNVESHWTWKWGDFDFEITMLQDAAHDYLPAEIHYKNVGQDHSDYFSDMKIQWTKEDKNWVPKRIEGAAITYQGKLAVTNQYFMKLDWRIGAQADDMLFECEPADYRLRIMKEFDVEFDFFIDGKTYRARWKQPEDLFMD